MPAIPHIILSSDGDLGWGYKFSDTVYYRLCKFHKGVYRGLSRLNDDVFGLNDTQTNTQMLPELSCRFLIVQKFLLEASHASEKSVFR